MANYTISQALARLQHLPKKVGDRAKAIMQEEIPKKTGELAESVKVEMYSNGEEVRVGPTKYVGGGQYGIRNLGAIVREGRPALDTRYARVLRWEDETGLHYATHVGKAKENDFIQKTINRLESEGFSL